MTDILAKIAAYKRDEVTDRKRRRTQAALDSAARNASSPRGFKRALAQGHAPGKLSLIAEIKKASPSKGLIRAADAYLIDARAAVSLPCIRKDFLVDPWQVSESRALGADAILVILAMIDDVLAAELMAEAKRLGMDALVEVHDEAEMARAGALGSDLVGINNRDLKSFVVDLAVTERLSAQAPKDALLVTESGIFTHDDVVRMEATGAKAMLVGESLMRQADVTAATRALLG
jgi:indole-3-glycerol phosphate synthase